MKTLIQPMRQEKLAKSMALKDMKESGANCCVLSQRKVLSTFLKSN